MLDFTATGPIDSAAQKQLDGNEEPMNYIRLVIVLSVGLLAFLPIARAERKPNIVVIFSDDQGYADLGCQGELGDIRTPHLDALGGDGVRCSAGYVTAPQCSPSRAGLLTGRYQQRFGYDDITRGPLPLNEVTLADRLQAAGYATGMVGKWHLEPDNSHQAWISRNKGRLIKNEGSPWQFPDAVRLPYMPEQRGFNEYFCGVRAGTWCRANFAFDSADVSSEGTWTSFEGSRTRVHTDAAIRFIERRKPNEPFFLYLCYSIPHVPLDATPELLSRFPGDMPERRRYALAMISEMDDGIGEIVSLLKQRGEYDNTLFFFASDNGAPLKLGMPDTKPPTAGGPTWTGSRNDPFSGEKGMLTEGGIRVPFVVTWKKRLAPKVYTHPVSALDVAATSLTAAGINLPQELDGVDLIPYMSGEKNEHPHQSLFWRFWNQAAVRTGDWKYLQAGPNKAYLFNLRDDPEERVNLLEQHSQKAKELALQLEQWATEMRPPRLPNKPLRASETGWYQFHIDSKLRAPQPAQSSDASEASMLQPKSIGDALLKDTDFSEGFGAAFIYGSEFTGGRHPPLGNVTKYRNISPWQVFLIPDGPVSQVGVKTHPWDFQEGLHHNFQDKDGRLVRELHAHRLVVNHTIEENSPKQLKFAQFNNYGLAKDHPERDAKLVKRVATDRSGTIRLYYNSKNEIRNAATGHSAKWARDTWPRFLVNQRITEPISLAQYDQLEFRVSYQVDQMNKLSNWPNAIRGAARSGMNLKFMFFLRNPDALEQKLFAGMMLFASNEKRYEPHLGIEQHGNIFYRDSVTRHGQPAPRLSEPRSIRVDIRDIVAEALRQGRLKQSDLSANLDDYAIYNFSIGFEGMGHWETEAEISDLSLVGKRRQDDFE